MVNNQFAQENPDPSRGDGRAEETPPLGESRMPPDRTAIYLRRLIRAIDGSRPNDTMQVLRELHDDDSLSKETRASIVNQPFALQIEGSSVTLPALPAYLQRDATPWREVIRHLLTLGANPNARTSEGESVLDLAIRRTGDPHAIRLLVQAGATDSAEGSRFDIDVVPESKRFGELAATRAPSREPSRESVDFKTLVDEVERIYLDHPHEIQEECREFIKRSGRLYDGYVYLRAADEATLVSHELEKRLAVGNRFIELTGIVLGGRHPREIEALVKKVEDLLDHYPHLHHWHQSEPELALLLGHPAMNYNQEDDAIVGNSISRSLTGIHRIYFRDVRSLPAGARETIADLGFLTHGFKFYRFDTEREKVWTAAGPRTVPGTSLLEQFGFERMPQRETDRFPDAPQRDHLGSGYVIRPHSPLLTSGWLARQADIDPEFHIEFRRAYILANHPKMGTLLIRNSSPRFGRDAFPGFAYWGPTPTERRSERPDLENPEHLIAAGKLRPVLTAEGKDYKNVALGLIQSQSVSRLVNGVMAVKDGYRRWKFDTDAESAWDVDPATNQRYPSGSGMHLSEGFPTLVRHLLARQRFISSARSNGHELREQLPDLAFFHPYLPAWHPQPFVFTARPDTEPVTRTRLRLTSDSLDGMKKLAERNLRRSDVDRLRHTGLLEFLMAGAATQGELVLVPPSDDKF